jgi:hypothetical protein
VTGRTRNLLPLLLALTAACSPGRDAGTTIELWALGREGEIVREMVPGFER